jgi:tetratricopeptide (TPR) repeat protein
VEKAIEHYEQALSIAREVGDRRVESYSLNNLGLAYHTLEQDEKARKMWGQALHAFEDIKSPHAETVRQRLDSLDK